MGGLLLAASLGTGLLLKSLIGVVFPVAAGLIYLAVTRQLFSRRTWKRLHPFLGTLIILAIAAPWHILATLRNPPYFAFTLHSGPGQYHGFLWFFFINEQLLRFLNLRYPRDYNTVPRVWFWLLHLVWLFPWSVYFPAVAKLSFKPVDRAGRTRLLALCWTGFMLVFFTFSTTQEYYSMPCYPALALLLGSAMAAGGVWVRRGTRVLAVIAGCAAIASLAILFLVRHVATPGDISTALRHQRDLHALARPHGRPHARLVCLSSSSTRRRGSRICDRRYRMLSSGGPARVSGSRAHDGLVLSRCASGHGGVRSLSFVASVGECVARIPARRADHPGLLLPSSRLSSSTPIVPGCC